MEILGNKKEIKIALERYNEPMRPWFITMVGINLANSLLKIEINFNGF